MFHGRSLHRPEPADRLRPTICKVDNSRRGAEIFLQINYVAVRCAFEFLPKFRNDFDFRAAKSVNGLSMISDRRQFAGVSGEQLDKVALYRIDVLYFVDDEVDVLFAQLPQSLSVSTKLPD